MQTTDGADQTGTPSAEPSVRRKRVVLALKLLAVMVIVAIPAVVGGMVVPGVFGVAYYGVLAATFGWLAGGPRVGAGVVLALSLLGSFAIVVRDHTWLLALVLVLLGVLYGVAASRGVGKAVLQLPILVPYFMMSAPALFHDPPALDLGYFVGVVVVMNLTGLWAIFVLNKAAGPRTLTRVEVPDVRVPLIYGTLLGIFSATVMVLGTTTELKSHWVWVTLTLYVLAEPSRHIAPKQMRGRLLGTFAGFGTVAVLALVGVPDGVLQALAIPALWLCVLFLVLKKAYWQYTFFLTLSVVMLNSRGVNTLVLDAERFGFTLVGAGLSMLAAYLVNLVLARREARDALAARRAVA